MSNGTHLSFPTGEFRSLPVPGFSDGAKTRAKLSTCFVACEDLPAALENWMAVNPRVPRLDKDDKLKGPVARAIVDTLKESPEHFALKNQGIWLIADDVTAHKGEGGVGTVQVTFIDPKLHGLANGGHTYRAIRQVAEERVEAGTETPWPAYVRLHILTGVDNDEFDVSELAEGLNRSMQVDDPSLENLKGKFDAIRAAMKGKRGEEQIEYRQGEEGELEIVTVLMMLALFDIDRFKDRKSHPNNLFGHGKMVLQHFIGDSTGAFEKVVPHVHEILVLSERLQQETVGEVAKMKISDAKKGNRVASKKHKRDAVFTTGQIGGKLPWGWLFPMLAAFRANVDRDAWQKGQFKWLAKPDDILMHVAEEMAQVVRQEHKDNKDKPAEVGRKEAAYRLCYGIVQMELAGRGHPVT